MPESFFELSLKDQKEALQYVRAGSGRPAHLFEKDIRVVWPLRTLFEAPIGAYLTFKGGTSLSRVYKVINRFTLWLALTGLWTPVVLSPNFMPHVPQDKKAISVRIETPYPVSMAGPLRGDTG